MRPNEDVPSHSEPPNAEVIMERAPRRFDILVRLPGFPCPRPYAGICSDFESMSGLSGLRRSISIQDRSVRSMLTATAFADHLLNSGD